VTEQAPAKLGGSSLFYRLIRFVLYIIYRVCFRFRYYGSENVPQPSDRRGVILAPNHASYLDPPILGISLKRRVTYLAKEYLFRHSFVGFVLRNIGAFPIKSDTGNDLKSIRDLIRILKQGHCVTVFPEGTRSETGEMKAAEGGIGFLAMKSGAWVVPVYIEGSYAAMPKGMKGFKCSPIRAFFGEAFIPAENKAWEAMEDYQAVSDKIMKDIRALKEKAERKV
jgi:1-acyl-sn-glycerol-3-phosphate acyltransferase